MGGTTLEQFNKLLKATDKPIFALFGVEGWCRPCRVIAPVFEDLAKTSENVVFVKIDIDASPELAVKYEISVMPTLKIIVKGNVVDQIQGGLSKEKLEQAVNKHSH